VALGSGTKNAIAIWKHSPRSGAAVEAIVIDQPHLYIFGDPALARDKAALVYARLVALYGAHALKPRDPLRQLIGTILSQRTKDEQTARSSAALWARWPTPELLATADVAEIERVIGGVTFPELKAPRIKRLLADIFAERSSFDLSFLGAMPTQEALAWLSRLEGVGPKTSTLVMLFVFGHPVLPVDTHVHRVSLRLGLIPPRTSAERAHSLLPALLPADAATLYTFHRNAIQHGKRTCFFHAPACHRCALRDICDYGNAQGARVQQ
jgi:endonuclease-3